MPCVGTQYHLGNPKQHHHRHHHFPHHRYYDYHNFLQCFEEMPCVCRYLGTTRVTLSRGIIVIITIISTIILISSITTRKCPPWIMNTHYQGTTLLLEVSSSSLSLNTRIRHILSAIVSPWICHIGCVVLLTLLFAFLPSYGCTTHGTKYCTWIIPQIDFLTPCCESWGKYVSQQHYLWCKTSRKWTAVAFCGMNS